MTTNPACARILPYPRPAQRPPDITAQNFQPKLGVNLPELPHRSEKCLSFVRSSFSRKAASFPAARNRGSIFSFSDRNIRGTVTMTETRFALNDVDDLRRTQTVG